MIERNMAYDGTFSSNGILFNETISVLDILRSEEVDGALAKEVKENSHLKINAESTRGRAVREIKKRNRFAGHEFWEVFAQSGDQERGLMFLYLCLKTYRILYDLHFMVTVKRYYLDTTIAENFYYKMAIDELSSMTPKVAALSETTLVKTLANYRSLLRVAGLLKGTQLVVPTVSDSFWEPYQQRGEQWFLEACFQRIK